ncbi:MAG: efflux RND transporter periplasmic adaptor subunit [Gemmatimonadales bacterium]
MSAHWPAGIVAAAALSLSVLACAGDPPAQPPPPQVTVAPVIEREITEWDDFSGRFQAVDVVEIRPRVSGAIQRVAFTEGREVRKGDVLFVVDPRPYQAELSRAQAELERTRTRAALTGREVERAERLVSAQAISREEFDTRATAQADARASVQAAEAAVETARLNLEWTRIRSPIAGRVGRAEVTEGNLVQAGPPTATLLTTVVSLDPIYVDFEGDEQSYLKYAALARSGERPNGPETRIPVQVGLSDEDGYPHEGYIDFVDNRLNPETGTIQARAVLSNKERRFTPGLFARVRLRGSAKYRATLIQDRAVATDQDKKYVLVLTDSGTVAYRPIQLGRLVDGLRVVREGLRPGERIVINGAQRVRPGMPVTAAVASMVSESTVVAAAR